MTRSEKKRTTRMVVIVVAMVLIVIAVFGAFIVGGLAGKLNVSPFSKPINFSEKAIRSTLAYVRGHEQNERYFESALIELKMTTLSAMPANSGNNVGFASIGDGHLVATRSGEIYLVELQWPRDASVAPLKLNIPTEKERFLQHPITKRHPRIPVQFGVKGIYVEQAQDRIQLYASYHFWKEADECAVFRIARADIGRDELLEAAGDRWAILYESSPCMRLDGEFNRLGEDDTFLQAGGRMTAFDDDRIIVTVGDHFLEGIHNNNYVQDTNASYGKTWLINKDNGEAEMFSLGHRNPQGITVDQYGLIWASEHGPRGGDELNLLSSGANFGWPEASFGTLYAGYLYPEGKDWSSHEGYEQPKYAWSPSIAPSNLVRLDGSRFERWGDDLILSSLSGRSIYRMRLDGTEVIAVEQIEIGDRLRDLAQTPEGDLLLMSDSGIFYKLEPAGGNDAPSGSAGIADADSGAARGRALWMSCAACHEASREERHRIGPNLYRVVNRPIADYGDFNYSAAMEAEEGEWTEERLDRFLESPMKDVPGTTMTFSGIKDEQDRRALIEYLKQLGDK